MKTDDKTLEAIQNLYAGYVLEIESSGITPLSRKVYIQNSANFVRWIAGDFDPGAKIRRMGTSAD